MTADPPDLLLLCKDLFFTSQLIGAAQRAGLTPQTCLSQRGCEQRLAEGAETVRWVVIDLELPELDLRALRSAAGEGCRLLAFGPHVRTGELEAARAAGCDVVLTRGQAASQLEQVLRSGS